MKTAVLILAAAGIVAAQTDLTGVPPCAQACIAKYLPQVGCALTDTVCQCKDETKAKLAPLVTPCLTSTCTPAELAQALAASEKICAAATAGPTSSAASTTEASETTEASGTETPEAPTDTITNSNVTKTEATPTPTKTAAATSAVVTAGAAQIPAMAGAGLLALLAGAIAAL